MKGLGQREGAIIALSSREVLVAVDEHRVGERLSNTIQVALQLWMIEENRVAPLVLSQGDSTPPWVSAVQDHRHPRPPHAYNGPERSCVPTVPLSIGERRQHVSMIFIARIGCSM